MWGWGVKAVEADWIGVRGGFAAERRNMVYYACSRGLISVGMRIQARTMSCLQGDTLGVATATMMRGICGRRRR